MKPFSKSIRVLILGATLCGPCITAVRAAVPSTTPSQPGSKPNIIFILADDLGYGDIGVTFQNARDPSKPKFATPAIDALAAEGMLLAQHYTGSPVCAPARGSLLTGQHQGNCAIRDNQFDKALPTNHTLATVMKTAGYDTIAIGKWGLQGEEPNYPGHPLRHGFDAFFGFLAHDSGHVYYQDEKHPLHDGFTDVTAQYKDVYSTDLFTAKAKKYIVDHQTQAAGKPFFMYLAYTAPHNPQEVPGNPFPAGGGQTGGLRWPLAPTPVTRDTWYDPDCGAGWGNRMKRYVTVIRRMDHCIGDVMQLLRDLKIDQNTLVIFTSDNGPSNEGIDPRRFDSWGPFDGFKRDLWEGGIREPTVAAWPGHIAAGKSTDLVSGFWDWMPTFADVAGLAPPAQADGVSLVPTLTNVGTQRSRGFVYEDYYYFSPPNPTGPLADIYARKHVTGRGVQQMLREEDFVAIRTQVHKMDDPLRLYNVVLDPHEDHNLANDPKYAERLKQMSERMKGIHRPDASAARPYDDEPVPAVTAAGNPGMIDADVYQGPWPWVPDLDALVPVSHRNIAGVNLSLLPMSTNTGVKFSGEISVPVDGRYTFYLTDDAGAQLWLHDAHVIDDDFNHNGSTVSGAMVLKAGMHPLRLFYRHGDAMPVLKFEIEGPGMPRQEISPGMLLDLKNQ